MSAHWHKADAGHKSCPLNVCKKRTATRSAVVSRRRPPRNTGASSTGYINEYIRIDSKWMDSDENFGPFSKKTVPGLVRPTLHAAYSCTIGVGSTMDSGTPCMPKICRTCMYWCTGRSGNRKATSPVGSEVIMRGMDRLFNSRRMDAASRHEAAK